jgi:hypothetical protein
MLARPGCLSLAQGAGLAFVPGSAMSLDGAVGRLCAMNPAERYALGDRGRRFYAKRLSFRRVVEATVRVYGSLAGGEPA